MRETEYREMMIVVIALSPGLEFSGKERRGLQIAGLQTSSCASRVVHSHHGTDDATVQGCVEKCCTQAAQDHCLLLPSQRPFLVSSDGFFFFWSSGTTVPRKSAFCLCLWLFHRWLGRIVACDEFTKDHGRLISDDNVTICILLTLPNLESEAENRNGFWNFCELCGQK